MMAGLSSWLLMVMIITLGFVIKKSIDLSNNKTVVGDLLTLAVIFFLGSSLGFSFSLTRFLYLRNTEIGCEC